LTDERGQESPKRGDIQRRSSEPQGKEPGFRILERPPCLEHARFSIWGVTGSDRSVEDEFSLLWIPEEKTALVCDGFWKFGQEAENENPPSDGKNAFDQKEPLPGGPSELVVEIALHSVCNQSAGGSGNWRCEKVKC